MQLLLQDVEATIGPGHEIVVRDNPRSVALFADDPGWYPDKLVEDTYTSVASAGGGAQARFLPRVITISAEVPVAFLIEDRR